MFYIDQVDTLKFRKKYLFDSNKLTFIKFRIIIYLRFLELSRTNKISLYDSQFEKVTFLQ